MTYKEQYGASYHSTVTDAGDKGTLILSNATPTDFEHFTNIEFLNMPRGKHFVLIGELEAVDNGVGIRLVQWDQHSSAHETGYIWNNESIRKTKALKFSIREDARLENTLLIRAQTYSNAAVTTKGKEFTSANFGGYYDNLRIFEITTDEFNNLTEDQLIEKYQYINGTEGTSNIMVEVSNGTETRYAIYDVDLGNTDELKINLDGTTTHTVHEKLYELDEKI